MQMQCAIGSPPRHCWGPISGMIKWTNLALALYFTSNIQGYITGFHLDGTDIGDLYMHSRDSSPWMEVGLADTQIANHNKLLIWWISQLLLTERLWNDWRDLLQLQLYQAENGTVSHAGWWAAYETTANWIAKVPVQVPVLKYEELISMSGQISVGGNLNKPGWFIFILTWPINIDVAQQSKVPRVSYWVRGCLLLQQLLKSVFYRRQLCKREIERIMPIVDFWTMKGLESKKLPHLFSE